MSEENGVSFTDIDQLIRKRQNVVEKSEFVDLEKNISSAHLAIAPMD